MRFSRTEAITGLNNQGAGTGVSRWNKSKLLWPTTLGLFGSRQISVDLVSAATLRCISRKTWGAGAPPVSDASTTAATTQLCFTLLLRLNAFDRSIETLDALIGVLTGALSPTVEVQQAERFESVEHGLYRRGGRPSARPNISCQSR